MTAKQVGAQWVATEDHRLQQVCLQLGWVVETPIDDAFLVVGLGGSGVYTARRLKQILRERYDTQGLIRFVYVDTDQGAMSQEPNLAEATSDEILTLSIAHPEQIVDEWRRNRALHSYLEFLNGDVNVGLLRNADGAAGIRPIGRFGFHASFDAVYPRLQRAVQEIMQVEEQVRALMATVPYKVRVISSQPRIYLIASLCGGTGSGIYFDTALVLRELLQQQNLDGELVGVFYLPSVFQHEVGISPSMREVIHANAYAALMELEYFCNANHINRDDWQVQYRMIPPIRIKEPLVDEAYLVEGANAAGRTLSSKYEVFEMTARSVLMDIGSPLGARAAQNATRSRSSMLSAAPRRANPACSQASLSPVSPCPSRNSPSIVPCA
ncbi:MAG: tubulin-like doman-containing protein [Fimbriimonadales bacterium]